VSVQTPIAELVAAVLEVGGASLLECMGISEEFVAITGGFISTQNVYLLREQANVAEDRDVG
jgi:hypothetical protein